MWSLWNETDGNRTQITKIASQEECRGTLLTLYNEYLGLVLGVEREKEPHLDTYIFSIVCCCLLF